MSLTAEQTTAFVTQLPWWLCVAFAALGCILLVASLRLDKQSLSVKMTGSSFVLSLAFAANQTVIYGVAMFIVATLVTELEFLERIAAIFWRSEPYFKYRMATASQKDVQEKIKGEIEDAKIPQRDSSAEKTAHATSRWETAVSVTEEQAKTILAELAKEQAFENQIASAILAGKSPFLIPGTLHRAKIIETKSFRGVFDLIYERPSGHYLIEVRTNAHVSINSVMKVRHYAEIYRAYLLERKIQTPVFPVLIVPIVAIVTKDTQAFRKLDSEVYILAFDGEKFINESQMLVPSI